MVGDAFTESDLVTRVILIADQYAGTVFNLGEKRMVSTLSPSWSLIYSSSPTYTPSAAPYAQI